MLELAEKLAANPLKRDVLFIAFDAEEKGLLGSKHFVDNPIVNLENVVTMLNLDMVGRLKDSTLTVGGTGTSPSLNRFRFITKKTPIKHCLQQRGFWSQ